jgi:putative FmdB family regulatory protein
MPLYEYECEAENGRRFEIIQKFSDPILTVCPSCGGPVRKLLSSPAIQFKGSGFYITDYAKKSNVDAGKESKSGSSAPSADSGPSASTTPAPASTTSTPAKKD